MYVLARQMYRCKPPLGCAVPGQGGLGDQTGVHQRSISSKTGGGDVSTSRRQLLGGLLFAAPLLGVVIAPRQAEAIGIESIYEALPSLYSSPSPVMVPRRTFGDTAFAVALLRSGYETVDDLDFFPMDTWQKEFWLKRRSGTRRRSKGQPLDPLPDIALAPNLHRR